VIEFVLLFGLGFLAAALVALIVAPVIQRRVVTLTERRIRASVPLSAAEIRAEKDMARAAYAADNARLSTDLKQNREALTEATAHGMRLSNELVAIRAEKLAAEQSLEERDASIRELNAKIHKSDGEIANLTGNLAAAIRLAEVRKQEIAAKEDKINHLGAEIEELRIDIATLDTEAENFKAQISELRDERRSLRDSLKATEEANHDLAFRLKREEGRLAEAEAKLAKTITALTDRENALERRVAEMERFKEKNRVLSEELKAAKRERTAVEMNRVKAPAPAPAPTRPQAQPQAQAQTLSAKQPPVSNVTPMPERVPEPAPGPRPEPKPERRPVELETKPETVDPGHDQEPESKFSEGEKIDRLRARQAALTERLMKSGNGKNDAALRREIATVAAMMVDLTAGREGKDSPILKILAGSEDLNRPENSGPSLAARARHFIGASQS
jgi:peptidoglycan hydrolase CwlO-like protein